MDGLILTIIGLVAASLTSFSFLPQVKKMLRRRTVGDLSILTILQMTFGNLLWLTYGIGRRDFVIISANVVAISILLFGIMLYYRYREKKTAVDTPALLTSEGIEPEKAVPSGETESERPYLRL